MMANERGKRAVCSEDRAQRRKPSAICMARRGNDAEWRMRRRGRRAWSRRRFRGVVELRDREAAHSDARRAGGRRCRGLIELRDRDRGIHPSESSSAADGSEFEFDRTSWVSGGWLAAAHAATPVRAVCRSDVCLHCPVLWPQRRGREIRENQGSQEP